MQNATAEMNTIPKEAFQKVAQNLLDTTSTDPEFLNTVITGDEEDDIERIPF